jgi:hypothetical protein
MSNMASRRVGIADTIDEYDMLIREHNESKADTFTCYRADLEKEGMSKEQIKAELAALKAAIRRRQKAVVDPQAVEFQAALVDEIYEQLKTGTPNAIVRGARGQQ